MTTPTFTRWLHRQSARRDAIGDLATDQRHDRCWPRSARDLDTYVIHLDEHGACHGAYEALISAWTEWVGSGVGSGPGRRSRRP